MDFETHLNDLLGQVENYIAAVPNMNLADPALAITNYAASIYRLQVEPLMVKIEAEIETLKSEMEGQVDAGERKRTNSAIQRLTDLKERAERFPDD